MPDDILRTISLFRSRRLLAADRADNRAALTVLDDAIEWPDYSADRNRLDTDLLTLVRDGQRFWAVWLARQHIDGGLSDAKAYVARLERTAGLIGDAELRRRLAPTPSEEHVTSRPSGTGLRRLLLRMPGVRRGARRP